MAQTTTFDPVDHEGHFCQWKFQHLVIKINVDILYLSVRTCVMIGQFHGPYFTPRIAKFKRQFELKSFLIFLKPIKIVQTSKWSVNEKKAVNPLCNFPETQWFLSHQYQVSKFFSNEVLIKSVGERKRMKTVAGYVFERWSSFLGEFINFRGKRQ